MEYEYKGTERTIKAIHSENGELLSFNDTMEVNWREMKNINTTYDLDFHEIFNIDSFTPAMEKYIEDSNFKYTYLSDSNTINLLFEICKKIDLNIFKPTGDDIPKWEKGWAENLEEYNKTKDFKSLIPKYMHPNRICRLNKRFIQPEDSEFELNFSNVLRYWMFETYLKGCDEIYEFGCGSGHSFPILHELYPNKKIYGLDRSIQSIKIVNALNSTILNLSGYIFDFIKPNYNLEISNNSGIFTIAALEQIGNKYHEFVNFIFDKKPKIICNIEPINEFYDENNFIDYLAIKYHTQRNYLNGYYTYLKELEDKNKIKILKSIRHEFGGLYHEGWSIIIWEIL